MGTNYNPQIVTSGLVLCVDAANPKSYLYAENLLNYSQNVAITTSWGASNMTISPTPVLAPNGTLTANSVVETADAGAYHYINQVITRPTANAYYTFSAYVKSSTRQITLRMETSSGGGVVAGYNVISTPATTGPTTGAYNTGYSNFTPSIENFANGWCRISASAYISDGASNLVLAIFTSNTASNPIYDGNVNSGFFVWGPQLERSNVANPYVSTAAANVIASTTLTNLISSNNSGTLISYPIYNSTNKSFTFNGGTTDQYVTGNLSTIAAGSNVTTEAIIKLNTVSGVKNIFTLGRSAVTFSYGMVINNNSFRFRNSSNDHIFPSPTTLTTGVWYHLVLSSTATETTGYVNGVSQGTTANVVTNNAIPEYCISRRALNDASEYMNGEIALVRVYYNKAFTQNEVLQNFNATRGRFGI